ncbi:MAG: DUF4230 domain-containing protein [Lachnospiraceae bacterium]|nr:DUF4230 domain-containing protein [Lachnospiraceae bacterium]
MNEISTANESGNKPNIKFDNSKNAKTFLLNIVITAIIIICAFFMMNKSDSEKELEKPDFSGVTKIGELATLRCFYHNVAEYEKQPDGLFQYGLFQVGYKKFWIEYAGIVEIGINISKVKIGQPDEEGTIRVYVPEVENFRLNQDTTSIREPVYETGVFTTITTEEKSTALSQAQKDMDAKVRADQSLIQRAHENAKTLIEQYIINVGVGLGQEYHVVWVDIPQEVN